MSKKKIMQSLTTFGFSELDAKVYIYFAKKGPKKASEASRSLKISKQQLYPVIKRLQRRGILSATLERPARFSAVSFESVLDSFVKLKIDEARQIQQKKDDLLSTWKSIALIEKPEKTAKFTVIEGKRNVFTKMKQMMEAARSELVVVTPVPELIRVDQQGLFDAVFNDPSKSMINFRFLTDIFEYNIDSLKYLLQRGSKSGLNFRAKNPTLGLQLSPRMVIMDNKELLFFVSAQNEDDSCLWTTCKELVNSFNVVFEELWHNSIDIEEKISEIDSFKSAIEPEFVGDAKTIMEKFDRIIFSAKKEIIMMTSSDTLVNFWNNNTFSEKWCKRGVTVKLMAPLTNQNLEATKNLSQFIEIRHVSESHLETAIIDEKLFFQFKVPVVDHEYETKPLFRDMFFSNNRDHVRKLLSTLNNIWKKARSPSSVTLESIVGPSGSIPASSYPPLRKVKGVSVFTKEPGEITEKDVLDKVIKTDEFRSKSSVREFGKVYSSSASAIIHPPENFNLPDMMFIIDHIQKRSWLGQGDALLIYLKMKMPEGYLFVPAGGIGDNPQGVEHRKKVHFIEKNVKDNYRLVRKDELEIRVHGNNLFAGWTVPITLFPNYVLPPACIMIEGYGKVKTSGSTIISPSGYKFEFMSNYFDAFVTFMHPKSRYSGPGTDGIFFREVFGTTTPPEK